MIIWTNARGARRSGVLYSSPRLSLRASSAARSEAVAATYRRSMSCLVQTIRAIAPPSEPPAASQRDAAVLRNLCGCMRSIPASLAR